MAKKKPVAKPHEGERIAHIQLDVGTLMRAVAALQQRVEDLEQAAAEKRPPWWRFW